LIKKKTKQQNKNIPNQKKKTNQTTKQTKNQQQQQKKTPLTFENS